MDYKNDLFWNSPFLFYDKVTELLSFQNSKNDILVPENFDYSMKESDALKCLGVGNGPHCMFVIPFDKHLSNSLWNRLCNVFSYLDRCKKDGFQQCLLPTTGLYLLTCSLNDLYTYTQEAHEKGLVGS